MNKYCRLCAQPLKQGVLIFGEEGKRLQIAEKIRKTLSILILEEDSLPKKICTKCCSLVEDYCQYKESTVDAQEKLSSIVKVLEKKELASTSTINTSPSPSSSKKNKSQSSNNIEKEQVEEDDFNHHSPNDTHEVTSMTSEEEEDDDDSVPAAETEIPPSKNNNNSQSSSKNSNNASFFENFHSSVTKVKCGLCQEIFDNKDKLIGHHRIIHDSKIMEPFFQCIQCSKVSHNYTAIRTHFYRHRMTGKFSCHFDKCEKSYTTKSNLEEHLTSRHYQNDSSGKAFFCSDCGKRFHSKTGLTGHINTHHREIIEKSPSPPLTNELPNQPSTKSPERTIEPPSLVLSTSPISVQTTTSTTSNSVSTTINDTIITHVEISTTTNGSSSQENSLKIIKENESTSGSNNNTTKNKGESPSKKTSTQSPIKNPTNENDTESQEGQSLIKDTWQCDICNKILNTSTGLHNHRMTCKGRRFDCECGASYTQKNSLILHQKTKHSNEPKNFKCTFCSKEFYQLKFLNIHTKSHHLLEPTQEHSCDICKKNFRTSTCLRRHMKYHNGKNYNCSYCGKAFINNFKLEEHMNSHTNLKPYECGQCNRRFNSKPNYVKHVRRKHPSEIGKNNKCPPPIKKGVNSSNTSSNNNSNQNSNNNNNNIVRSSEETPPKLTNNNSENFSNNNNSSNNNATSNHNPNSSSTSQTSHYTNSHHQQQIHETSSSNNASNNNNTSSSTTSTSSSSIYHSNSNNHHQTHHHHPSIQISPQQAPSSSYGNWTSHPSQSSSLNMTAHHHQSHHHHNNNSNIQKNYSGENGISNALDLVDTAIQNALVCTNHPVCNETGQGMPSSSSSSSSKEIPQRHITTEPMEFSYNNKDAHCSSFHQQNNNNNNNFQEMPMELTSIQRDPLELCVRQDFTPLIDLTSGPKVVSGQESSSIMGGMSINMGINHKFDLTERELMDLSGAFRQPIDLISRTDDNAPSLCNEGNLVDLSLRHTSFVNQDQTASSFLRELIDLSSRSDSHPAELDLTKHQHHSQTQHATMHSMNHQQHPQSQFNLHSHSQHNRSHSNCLQDVYQDTMFSLQN